MFVFAMTMFVFVKEIVGFGKKVMAFVRERNGFARSIIVFGTEAMSFCQRQHARACGCRASGVQPTAATHSAGGCPAQTAIAGTGTMLS
jgi:hypothetical protein